MNLLKAASLVSLLTLASRVTGLVREQLVAALRHLALLAAVCFAAGGWWLLRSALSGDPGDLLAQKSMHNWAIRGNVPAALELLPVVISGAARSFIAMFSSVYFGIPDRIYAVYLFVAAALAGLVVLRVRAIGRRDRPAHPTLSAFGSSPSPARSCRKQSMRRIRSSRRSRSGGSSIATTFRR